MTRDELIAETAAKITSGASDTTARDVREVLGELIDSCVNATDDADVPEGYMKINAAGRADASFVKSAAPTGYYLEDNGVFGPIEWEHIFGYPDASSSLVALIAAKIAATIKPVFYTATDSGNSGTGITNIYNPAMAAGQLAEDGDSLDIVMSGTFVGSGTATKQISLLFGSTTIFDSTAITIPTNSVWVLKASVIRKSTSSIRYSVTFRTLTSIPVEPAVGEVTGLTLSNAITIRLNAQAAGVGAATNDIVLTLAKANYVKTP